jgi:hypothetical protein
MADDPIKEASQLAGNNRGGVPDTAPTSLPPGTSATMQNTAPMHRPSGSVSDIASGTPLVLREQKQPDHPAPITQPVFSDTGMGGDVAATLGGAATLAIDASVLPAVRTEITRLLDATPLAIRPTIYPTPPGDTVAVEDPVSINVGSDEFREFVNKVNGLLEAIRQSNEIAREVRDKATAELEAGLKYIAGPKPSRKVIDLLLVNPLTWAALGLAGTLVGEAGKLAFKALLKLISPDIDIGL